MKPVYKAADGSEHATAEKANQQNKLLRAMERLKDAGEDVRRCLANACSTADGEPFDFGRSADYWYVTPANGIFLPRIGNVWIFPHTSYVDSDYNDSPICVRWYDSSRRDYTHFKINELYSTKEAAKAAWFKAMDEYAANVQKQVDECKKSGV